MAEEANRPYEVRAGLVLYGGISLAVYMGGVAVEFLRAVKAGMADRPDGAAPYAPLLERLEASFVVDVISGASAGGINGVFLARALTTGGNLEHMGRLWREAGDMARLLDWSGEGESPASFLNGRFFLRELRQALRAVGEGGGRPLVGALDLHVAATDINGSEWRRFDHLGHEIIGRRHRKDFHFKFRRPFRLAGQNEDLGYERNDFADPDPLRDREKIERLSKVARTTAAFPSAFEPVGFACGKHGETDEHRRTNHWMTDGGVLQNRPFAPVINTIFYRAADRPVERLLFYVEPDPSDLPEAKASADVRQPSPFRVALAAFDLPLYQGIDQHLRDIEDHNRHVAQIRELTDAIKKTIRGDRLGSGGLGVTPGYLALRRCRVATELKGRLEETSRSSGVDPPFDWLPEALTDSDKRYLELYDFRFEERRLHFVIEQLTWFCGHVLKNSSEDVRPELWRWAEAQTRRKASLWQALEELRQAEWDWWNGTLLRRLLADRPFVAAEKFRLSLRAILDAWHRKHDRKLEMLLGEEARPPGSTSGIPGQDSGLNLRDIWKNYAEYDALIFPLEIGSTLGERDRIDWVRISPFDADTLLRPTPGGREEIPWTRRKEYGRSKVAGDALFHFGGFLSRRWRRNDYMWGRLDAADILISSLIEAAQRSGRFSLGEFNQIVGLAQDCRLRCFREILKQELSDRDLRSLTGGDGRPGWNRQLGEQDVDTMEWEAIRRNLLNACRVGRETSRDLPSGVLAHTAVDLAANFRGVVNRVVRESKVRLPLSAKLAWTAVGAGLGLIRLAVRALVPRSSSEGDE